jgi:dCMP deaminase
MDLAKHISSWSKDPSTKIGCVIVDSNTRNVLSLGYNGFPRGIDDNERLYDRNAKLPLVVHAEMNAIYNAGRNGTNLNGSMMYVYGLPVCHSCSLGIIQAGIANVFVCEKFLNNERWYDSWEMTKANFKEAGVKIHVL